jgi:hypothetical protein
LLLGNKRLFHALNRFDNGQNKYGHQLQLVDGPGNGYRAINDNASSLLRRRLQYGHNVTRAREVPGPKTLRLTRLFR